MFDWPRPPGGKPIRADIPTRHSGATRGRPRRPGPEPSLNWVGGGEIEQQNRDRPSERKPTRIPDLHVLLGGSERSVTPCALLQVLYMSSFLFTLNYVWQLFTGVRDQFYSSFRGYPAQFSNRVNTAAKVTALLSCLLPVLLMAPVFIAGTISQCQANFSEPYRCLLMHTGPLYLTSEPRPLIRTCSLLQIYHMTVFLITFILTLLSITVLVVKARHIYRRVVTSNGYLGNQQRASFRVMDRRMLLYPLVLVLCWGPAVGLAFLRVAAPPAGRGDAGVVLYISQAFTSASQGFLNSLVYGWTHVHLRRAGRMLSCRDADTQTPLLRAQKTRSYQTLRSVG
ncbi:transmembrane protein 116 isoform X2 [Brachyistius frenatus]|uniref:transmembrane protein 116 isoform X2 n=1 Tax=Brachyistius frenatus TaxID=100188 RepID=UPI0037E9B31C